MSVGDLAFLQLPALKRLLSRGASSVYSSALSAAGAYQKNDLLKKRYGVGRWVNTVDGNPNDPDSATYDGWVDEASVAPSRQYAKVAHLPVGRVLCILLKSSPQIITNNNTTALTWQNEITDLLSLHTTTGNGGSISDSEASTRITLDDSMPDGTLLNFRASVVHSAPSDQVVAGVREVSILKNGTTVVARASIPANPSPTRSTIVHVQTQRAIEWVQGDYYQVTDYQNKGGDISIAADAFLTTFSCIYEGEMVGSGAARGVTFDPAVRERGLKAFNQIPYTVPARVRVMDDPVLGPGYPAIEFFPRNTDDSADYPRAQLNGPSAIAAGDDIYCGWRWYIHPDIPSYTGKSTPVMFEVYGEPLNGYGPNVMRIYDNKLTLAPQPLYDPTTGAPTGELPTWQFDYAAYKGRHIDIVMRLKMATTAYDASTNPTGGFHELWIDKLDGNGLVQQTLRGGGTRFAIATLRAGVNDGGLNYATWKSAFTDKVNIQACKLVMGGMKVGTSLAAVAPNTYDKMQRLGLV